MMSGISLNNFETNPVYISHIEEVNDYSFRSIPANWRSRSATVSFTCARNIVQQKIDFYVDVERLVCFPCVWLCFICVSSEFTLGSYVFTLSLRCYRALHVQYLRHGTYQVTVKSIAFMPKSITVSQERSQFMMTSSNGNIFALLALCAGNSRVTGEFPSQRPVTRSFDVFFDMRLNKRLSKQSWGWWFETPSCSLWRHCNVVNKCFPIRL